MRKAAATRVLALFRFFFLTGLPPLLGTRGAKVTWETNCFSVGKQFKSEPYSLTTTSTLSTPMASICVISTPLIRYKACRFASCPRFLILLVQRPVSYLYYCERRDASSVCVGAPLGILSSLR